VTAGAFGLWTEGVAAHPSPAFVGKVSNRNLMQFKAREMTDFDKTMRKR
jgi:hypothetical protein